VVVSILLISAVWAADRKHQHSEFQQLAGCVRNAEIALSNADQRLSAMAQYVVPSLSSTESSATATGLLLLVSQSVAPALGPLARSQAACGATSVLFVDRRLSHARRAYLDYLGARAGFMADIAQDGSVAFEPPEQISALRERARRSLTRAALNDAERRLANALLGGP
jgi:hypothetical protein